MTEHTLTDWLTATLPPEAGPLCLSLIAHWDAARPLLLVVAVSILAVQVLALRALWRWWRGRQPS